jgi:hypothetical protein
VQRSSLVIALAVFSAIAGCTGNKAAAPSAGTLGAPVVAAASQAAPATSIASVEPSPAVAPPVELADAAPPAPPAPELPLGGREIFPTYRLIGYCGTPGGPALGQLLGNLPAKAKSMKSFADKFPPDRKPLLVFELIAVVTQSYEGADKMYRRRVDDSVVDEYLKVARQSKGLLLLNIQPGRADFMGEVKHFEKYLKEPDVGVALDPEWAVKAKQKPGVFYGQAKGSLITEVADYLAGIVKENNLPEKALVFHQLNKFVVVEEQDIKPPPGVAIVKSIDGLGPIHAKHVTYDSLIKLMAPGVHAGFKLFLDEDKRIGGQVMSPQQVMDLKPQPEYVMVE